MHICIHRIPYDYLKKIAAWKYMVYFILGALLTLCEFYLLFRIGCLDYEGHFIGFAVMTFAVCGLVIAWDGLGINRISYYGGGCAKIIYALHNPVYYLILTGIVMTNADVADTFITFGSLIVYGICVIIGIIVMELLPYGAKRQF